MQERNNEPLPGTDPLVQTLRAVSPDVDFDAGIHGKVTKQRWRKEGGA
jgi:hypothetical protein